ncbi:NAD(P)-binding domain-containing protein [Companilactobacillus musae]|uniref:NADPH-dependent F420 reductase n=1 Tax=Companilactobacillus musae TaxID=1903258 RepID=UPI000E64942C|nr:NAD(P)-binding domain-containing protein [Companilactobacillus musae]
MVKPVLGILGAGKLGMTLAKLGIDAGYEVNIAGSREPARIELSVSVLAKGAHPMIAKDVIEKSEVIILALPLSKYQQIDSHLFAQKLVIDSMNYWWETDGLENDYYDQKITSSESVQEYLSESLVIKAFNHMGYHDLAAMSHQKRAIVYAGNNETALKRVARIIDDFGFEPYYLGTLNQTKVLQPSGILFGTNETISGVKELLKNNSQ